MSPLHKLLSAAVVGLVGSLVGFHTVGAQAPGRGVSGATGATTTGAGTVRAGADGLRARSAPSIDSPLAGNLANGAKVTNACRVNGQRITGTVATTETWLRLANGSFVSAAYVAWPQPGPPPCPTAASQPRPAPVATGATTTARPGGATEPSAPTAPRATGAAAPTTALAPETIAADLAASVPGQPATTRSWYLRTAAPEVLHQAGCVSGRAHRDAPGTQQGAVVLSFGGMVRDGGTWALNLYGNARAGERSVGDALLSYIEGYLSCSDATSTLTVAFGTTTSVGETSAASGRAFAALADAVVRRAGAKSARVTVVGGNDIELGYVGPAEARAWVDNYRASTELPLVYYGDAAGCPADHVPEGDDCGSREHPEWTAEDTWYVVSRPNTLIMPGNYVVDGVQARQWRNLSRYAAERHGRPLVFLGVLSQRGACRTRPCTERVRNDSGASWQQLSTALGGERLAVSDIAWLGE